MSDRGSGDGAAGDDVGERGIELGGAVTVEQSPEPLRVTGERLAAQGEGVEESVGVWVRSAQADAPA